MTNEKQDALRALEELELTALDAANFKYANDKTNLRYEREDIVDLAHNVRAALSHTALIAKLRGITRGAATEDEAMCQVTSIYNEGYNTAIDDIIKMLEGEDG